MGLAFVQPMSLLQGIAELSSDPQLTVLMLRLHSAVIEGEVRGSGSAGRGARGEVRWRHQWVGKKREKRVLDKMVCGVFYEKR